MHTVDQSSLTFDDTPGDAWLLVELGAMQMLLPSADSLTLMPIEGEGYSTSLACGKVTYEQASYPVFSLKANLHLLSEGDSQCRWALLLQAGQLRFALACQNLQRLDHRPEPRYTVPGCMRGRRQPFTEFTVLHGRAAPLTCARALAELLEQRGVKFSLGVPTIQQQGEA